MRTRLLATTILLLPIAIGLAFRAETSAHGDSSFYRRMPQGLLEMGAVPLQPWEWSHTGHHLVIAPLLVVQKGLGLGDETLLLCQVLNFVLHGLLACALFALLRARRPELSPAPAVALGLGVATLPGWLWTAQMPLSDVSGNALILLAAVRFVLHETHAARGTGRAYAGVLASYATTGFVIGLALLFRLSSLGFGFLFVYLGLRVLAVTPRGRRLAPSLALGAGALLPILALYAHWIATRGWEAFLRVYLRSGGDNSGFRAGFGELLERWAGHWLLGLGPGLLGLSAAGLALATLLVLRGGGIPRWRGQGALAWGGAMFALPYLVLVAHNGGWAEFRYQVPVLCLAATWVAYSAVGVERLWGKRAAYGLGGLLVAANAIHAYPMLDVLDRRQGFLEEGTRALVEQAPEDAAILTNYSLGFVEYHGEHQWWIPAHPEVAPSPTHHSYLPPSFAAQQLLIAHREGRELWLFNDPTLDGVRRWLRGRGWREIEEQRRAFDTLRHYHDPLLSTMRVEPALRPHPLRLLRLEPPQDIEPRLRHSIEALPGPPLRLRVHVQAPGLASWRYRLVFGTRPLEEPRRVNMPGVRLPFAFDDELYQASLFAVEEAPADKRATVDGRIGTSNEVVTTLPPDWSRAAAAGWSTVLFYEEGDWPLEARLRTQLQAPADQRR